MRSMLIMLALGLVAFVAFCAWLSTIPDYDCNQIVEKNLRESCIENQQR